MREINVYKIGFIVLIIANAILAFLFFQRPERPPHHQAQAGLMEKISEQLALNEEQKTRYFELARIHREGMFQLEEDQKEFMASYFNNLKSAQADSVEVSHALEQLQSLEGKKLSLTYSHFEELKALCNEDQKARFGLIMEEVIGVLTRGQEKLPPRPRDQ